jgi:hypothetical protein
MKSKVAEEVREARRREIFAMTPEERIVLAPELGERSLTLYTETHGVSREEARRIFEESRERDRRRAQKR